MGQLTIYLPDETEKQVRVAARRAKTTVSAYLAEIAVPSKRRGRWPKGYEKVLGSWKGRVPELEDLPPDDVEPF